MKKSSFFNKNLRRKLAFSIGAVVVVLLGVAGFFIRTQVSKSYAKISADYLSSVASQYAENTQKILSWEYAICQTLKNSLEQFESIPAESRRNYINALLKSTLLENENLVDTWTLWEPNALDELDDAFAGTQNHDSTGRFIPYWTKVGSIVEQTPLTDYVGASWYNNPLKSRTGILIDPNPYEIGGKTIYVCGVAFPVKNKAGKAVGVVGVDMSLDTLTNLLRSAKIFESGYLSLISATGLVAADKDKSREGKIANEFKSGETAGRKTV